MQAQEVSQNILSRVFKIRKLSSPEFGSSFTIEVDDRQYLITAKHVLQAIRDNDSIEIMQNNAWKEYKVKVIDVSPSGVDIVALALPSVISPTLPLGVSGTNFFISQTAYFLGFPFGLQAGGESLNNGFPLPLVKRGMFSAFIQSPDDFLIVYLDGLNNKGFSGGPIVCVDDKTKQLTAVAVVSSYISNTEPIIETSDVLKPENLRKDTGRVVYVNSGIVQGHSLKPAIDAIKKKPIGPLITK